MPMTLLEDCDAILTESRCAEFCTDLCAEARRRGIPVIVDVDRAMSLREGLLTASSHLVFSSEPLQETADVTDDGEALQEDRQADAVVPGGHARRAGHDLARRTSEPAADAGLSGAYRRYAGRGRRVPWRVRARHHRKAGSARRRCGSHPPPQR